MFDINSVKVAYDKMTGEPKGIYALKIKPAPILCKYFDSSLQTFVSLDLKIIRYSYHNLPIFTIFSFMIRGILACLPLILLQLIVCIRAKTFGGPLAVSIVFTLPAIIVASTPLGQIYPWTQPILGMSPEDESPI